MKQCIMRRKEESLKLKGMNKQTEKLPNKLQEIVY